MLEQIADEMYAVLQGKNLKCEVEADDDIVVRADPDKLARVFDNLMRNAIAYCRKDSTIRIHVSQDESNALIVFVNEGPKISNDKLQHIFEKFFRRTIPGPVKPEERGSVLPSQKRSWNFTAAESLPRAMIMRPGLS